MLSILSSIQQFFTFLAVACIWVGLLPLTGEQMALASQYFLTAQAANTGSKRALDAVWRLPEVQQKAREIRRLSNGRVRVQLMVESEPTREEPFYTIGVFEAHSNRIVTLYRFRVASSGGTITVLDDVTGEYISLQEWRK